MKMMLKKVSEPVITVDLPDEYETIREMVGGLIEAVYLEQDVIAWCNEEGKLIGLPHNFSVGNVSLNGDILFTGNDGEGGNKDLTDEQEVYVQSLFADDDEDGYKEFVNGIFNDPDAIPEKQMYTFNKEDDGSIADIVVIATDDIRAHMLNLKDEDAKERNGMNIMMTLMTGGPKQLAHYLNWYAKRMATGQI